MTTLLTHQVPQPQATGPAAPADRGRLARIVQAIRLAIQEMNYASRRLVELQAPWTVDKQWHRK
jgi:hypothetical protein